MSNGVPSCLRSSSQQYAVTSKPERVKEKAGNNTASRSRQARQDVSRRGEPTGHDLRQQPAACPREGELTIFLEIEYTDRHQKYYITVMLVEVTSIDELIDRLKKGKFVSKEDVLAESELSILIACPLVPTHCIQGSRVWLMTTKSSLENRKCH